MNVSLPHGEQFLGQTIESNLKRKSYNQNPKSYIYKKDFRDNPETINDSYRENIKILSHVSRFSKLFPTSAHRAASNKFIVQRTLRARDAQERKSVPRYFDR